MALEDAPCGTSFSWISGPLQSLEEGSAGSTLEWTCCTASATLSMREETGMQEIQQTRHEGWTALLYQGFSLYVGRLKSGGTAS